MFDSYSTYVLDTSINSDSKNVIEVSIDDLEIEDVKIGYVIATSCHNNSNKEISSLVLHHHLCELLKLIQLKYSQNIPSYITDIIVMMPNTGTAIQQAVYYEKERWESVFKSLEKSMGVTLHFIPYYGNNKHHSYDQWIQGYLMTIFRRLDYYIFIEDDYCLDSSNKWVDKELIHLYKSKFNDNVGYLATLVTTYANKYDIHASISNGIVSVKTLEKIPNILSEFYWRNYNTHGNYIPQIRFSQIFKYHGIPVADYRAEGYTILFWNSCSDSYINYTLSEKAQISDSTKSEIEFTENPDSKGHIFIPIQYVMRIKSSIIHVDADCIIR